MHVVVGCVECGKICGESGQQKEKEQHPFEFIFQLQKHKKSPVPVITVSFCAPIITSSRAGYKRGTKKGGFSSKVFCLLL